MVQVSFSVQQSIVRLVARGALNYFLSFPHFFFQVSFSCQQRIVRLVARGALSYGRVDLLVRDSVQKHDRQPVWVPTRQGFCCQVLDFFFFAFFCECVCLCLCLCLCLSFLSSLPLSLSLSLSLCLYMVI